MPTKEFLERIIHRLDRLDRHSLEHCVAEVVKEKQLLDVVLDSVPYGIMVVSPQKELLYLNRRIIHLFNVPDSIGLHASMNDLIADEPLRERLAHLVENRQECFNESMEVLLPRPMEVQVTLIFISHDQTEAAVCFISNLTQKELSTREQFQIQNWESMTSLASGIAHEIGNPLNSLAIHLKLLSKTVEKIATAERKKIQQSLNAMQDETARLDAIIRNFLHATRRKPLHFEPGNVNQLVRKTLLFLQPELQSARIKVRSVLDRGIFPFLIDTERMRQVIMNVVKNAVHAMPNGGTLTITSELKGKLCQIHFQDTGIGIPENELPRIFDAYFTTKEEGTGLGLLIVYQIIREHGGRIEVVSRPKAGTTFTIILPIRKEKLGLPGPRQRNVP